MKVHGTVLDQSSSSDCPRTDGIIVMGLCPSVARVQEAGSRASLTT